MYDVKSLSQPDTMPLFENNYRFQMTETGFAEYFRAQDGDCIDLFENFSENSLKEDLSNDTTLTPPLFFKYCFTHCL